ncbi:MAG: stage II sporulation protein D [Candidatus Limivicinus sp.]
MRKILLISYIVLLVAFTAPMLPVFRERDRPEAPEVSAVQSPAPVKAEKDREKIRLLCPGGVLELELGEYLRGAVAAEMPASFSQEALKAQAVASRTFALYTAASGKHDDADICSDSGCCQAWLDEGQLRERWGDDYEYLSGRIRSAVEDTAGEYLSYEGKPVFAAFHSSSAGATEDSGAIWNPEPYLVSVSSPESAEDVPGFLSEKDFRALDFRDIILSRYPDADFTPPPEDWITELGRDGSGRVEYITLGGIKITGPELRSLFSLRSAAFQLSFSEGVFHFSVAGFGHGVGMSQYGANVMAQKGSDYTAILAHYYPGTVLIS